MDQVSVFKALGNESRLNILRWLKDPERHFGSAATEECRQRRDKGVCVGAIQEKLGLCQSTASHYLAVLEQAGLVVARRCGQWTYYERNEDAIRSLSEFLNKQL
ncbi:MAG TPA: metalloregulator ArsR/SmtB family transcription factor [Gammaproteobacteria bacterium]|jgi:ArsR family transcriptional regulator|nr:metalloregulator ArsR/SmtB family transcription factor [Gammaproteobacteria bacterium]